MSELTEPTAEVPPVPTHPQPPVDPATLWAVPAQFPPKVRKPRPWLRTAARWSTAVVVCVAVGAGTAFGVMAPRRTDVPGLRTPADARYAFPPLSLPPLPPGASAPSGTSPVHAADLRLLLLPAPIGAKPDRSYPGRSGWFPTAKYSALFVANNNGGTAVDEAGTLADAGVRHVAATAWTTPDGTRTEVYLLAFRSEKTAETVQDFDTGQARLTVAPLITATDPLNLPDSVVNGRSGEADAVKEVRKATRVAFLQNGDIEVTVVMTNPKAVPLVDFQQVVALQAELLQG